MILLRKVRKEVRPLLYGASSFALWRKEVGLRPIAVGLTLRRLVAKVLDNRVAAQMGINFGLTSSVLALQAALKLLSMPHDYF